MTDNWQANFEFYTKLMSDAVVALRASQLTDGIDVFCLLCQYTTEREETEQI